MTEPYGQVSYMHPQESKPNQAANFTWNASRAQAIEFIERSPEHALFVVIERFSK